MSAARGFLRSALSDLGLTETSGDLIDLLVMAANELATNAVLHARTEFTIRVLADPIRVRVEVSDANPRMPQPSPAPAHATSGRGLAIIDGSGLQWGVDPHPDGKTMWLQATRLKPIQGASGKYPDRHEALVREVDLRPFGEHGPAQ